MSDVEMVTDQTDPSFPLGEINGTRLDEFLRNNPESSVEVESNELVVLRPWGDRSLELRISDPADEVVDALNSLYLPPFLSAVWHIPERELEVIWTAVPATHDLRLRNFSFHFEGRSVKCSFEDASSRLILLSRTAKPRDSQTRTQYRNLPGIYMVVHYQEAHPEAARHEDLATSFWIRGLEAWNDQEILNLVRSLNFYMSYYDRRSPRILVHEETPETIRSAATRFPAGPFPSDISGRSIDPFLVGLWTSAVEAVDPFRRFIYAYQVLEYASFFYRRDATTLAISKILAAPDLLSRQKSAAREILDIVANDNMTDDQRLTSVVRALVDPSMLWHDIQAHKDYFSKGVHFEGGFDLQPLIRNEWTLDDFRTSWDPKFADNIRWIRNALVHARDTRQASVIWPNRGNYELLRPWLAPIMSAAMQVMHFWEAQ